MRVQGEIVIERPVEEVFDFVADERNEPSYNPRMVRAEKVTSGPVGAGTTFSSVMAGPGRRTHMSVEFTEFDRPHRIVLRAALPNMLISGTLVFGPAPQGTWMRWIWVLEPHGWYRILGPLVRVIGERQERDVWAALKRLLESPRVPPAVGRTGDPHSAPG